MRMYYELMDLETANAVGGFATEAEALAEIRTLFRQHGLDAVVTLALGYEDEQGNGAMIASGAELARRALGAESSGQRPLSA